MGKTKTETNLSTLDLQRDFLLIE